MCKFLVVLDDSCECLNVMCFVVMWVNYINGGVVILLVIFLEEFNYWIGVGEIMCEEVCECIVVYFEVFVKWMCDCQNIDLELIICEGEFYKEILDYI